MWGTEVVLKKKRTQRWFKCREGFLTVVFYKPVLTPYQCAPAQACHLLQHHGRYSPFCSLHAGGLLDPGCRATSEEAPNDLLSLHPQTGHWLV